MNTENIFEDINISESNRGDEADISYYNTLAAEQAALKAFKLANDPTKQEGYEDFDGIHCVDCDIDIPEARKKANPNAIRCIHCQSSLEHRNKQLYG